MTAAVLLVMSNERRLLRFTAFSDLDKYKLGPSYQPYQAAIALADGGYENGTRPAITVVPEPASNAMLTIGVIGAVFCRWRLRGLSQVPVKSPFDF